MRGERVKIGHIAGMEPPKPDAVEQPGYSGPNHWTVSYAGRQLLVHAADTTAAMFWAAKAWGYSFRRPEYHQNAKVTKAYHIG